MKTTAILKKALIKILRKSPATLDLLMDICTDLIIERATDRLDKIMSEETGNELKAMILNR